MIPSDYLYPQECVAVISNDQSFREPFKDLNILLEYLQKKAEFSGTALLIFNEKLFFLQRDATGILKATPLSIEAAQNISQKLQLFSRTFPGRSPFTGNVKGLCRTANIAVHDFLLFDDKSKIYLYSAKSSYKNLERSASADFLGILEADASGVISKLEIQVLNTDSVVDPLASLAAEGVSVKALEKPTPFLEKSLSTATAFLSDSTKKSDLIKHVSEELIKDPKKVFQPTKAITLKNK